MALYHVATLTPTKAEMITRWATSQEWCPTPERPVEVIGAYRFDDPDGRVGMETHLIKCGETLFQVPLTYREAPVAKAESVLVGEMEHSALGTRWVYDGFGDEHYLVMLAAVSMTGQGEALGMVINDGRWVVAPTHVRIRGGGWTQERVAVDGFRVISNDARSTEFRNDRFSMIVHRQLTPGDQPRVGLTATWDGQSDPVILAQVSEL